MPFDIIKSGFVIPKNDDNKENILKLKKELSVKAIQVMKWIQAKPVIVKAYQETADSFVVPKHWALNNISKDVVDKQPNGKTINIKFNGELRPLQKEIMAEVLPKLEKLSGGVLCLPCAAGKTVLSLYLASLFKVKTLVIVHKGFLVKQWKERIGQFTNATVGMIQGSKLDIDKDIVIGMLQTVAKDKHPRNIYDDFGLVIFDEAHHAPSKYFSQALPIIASKITVGLSATPKRSDGLEKILYWYFGEILYKAKTEIINSVQVKIYKYSINHDKFKEYYMPNGEVNRALGINKLTTIGRRNKMIVDLLEEALKEAGRKVLILSDRVEHLEALKARIDSRGLGTTDYYIGGMKDEKLKIAEKAQIILGTYPMASEGLDIPDLNTLFMTTSRREVEQSVGRITRKLGAIRPIVYDIVDQIEWIKKQGAYRKKFYKKKGFEINNWEIMEDEMRELGTEMPKEPEEEKVEKVYECDFIDD